MRAIIILFLLIISAEGVLYQIDQPVPISLAHGEYYAGVRLWGEGGVLARFGVGLFDRLTLGMSYSVNRLIGSDKLELARARPELLARVAILKELGYVPDLAIGFEGQGYDYYSAEEDRFSVKEKGVYLAVGKSLEISRTYCQLGVNWWQGFNGFIVVNQLLPGAVELIGEYDPGLNDIPKGKRWQGGWLNFGVAWTFQERMRLSFALRDILRNNDSTRLNRVFAISFHESF